MEAIVIGKILPERWLQINRIHMGRGYDLQACFLQILGRDSSNLFVVRLRVDL
jgi:hypothetical protein